MEKKSSGFIKISRKIMDEIIFDNPRLLKLYIYCHLRANFKRKRYLKGLGVVNLKRGQFITSMRHMADDLKMSLTTLYRYLGILEAEHLTERRATTKYTVFTVKDYMKNKKTEHLTKHKVETEKNVKEIYSKNSFPTDNREERKKSSKNSLTPCPREELIKICWDLKLYNFDYVERKHQDIIDLIEAKEFKHKTVYHTLRRWVRMGIDRGEVKTWTPEEKMAFQIQYPEIAKGEENVD